MRKYLILAIILVLLGGGGFAYSFWQKQKEAKLLSNNPQTQEAYAKVLQRQKDIKKDKNNYDAYMSLAFSWKGIGEATKNDAYLQRAVDAYDKVIKRWGMKAYLPFLNRANVFILLKEYEKAETDLKVASEIDPGEQNLYISLADLYSGYMKKSDKEIRAVYESGMTRVVGGASLVLNYASYLNDAGDYKEALKYYKMLSQAYPDNAGYAEVIKDLQTKVPAQTK